ncbi:hypothetical protein [Streptomyces spinosisporus]|uniref:Uncharacterized protein n=1 Tax=Streptomyces spinosisporus TaxID=2927582 RepID=A0ABS9XJ12_9ACTN|nr:hypothetical protein [Streptomyces spinosisporus]MCI3242055.1 hypothetical protein [Streptomyces spinosisporus]
MPLLLALAAKASGGTVGWAAVGLPQMGALAAQSAGLELSSGIRIDDPGRQWAQVLATVAEAVPVVLVGRLGPVPDRIARRLAAVLRRSGSVLLAAGSWQGAEVRMKVVSATWEGLGGGHGLLRGRRVRVAAAGRGTAAVARYAEMWLPGADGQVTAALPTPKVHVPALPAAKGHVTALPAPHHPPTTLPPTQDPVAAPPATDGPPTPPTEAAESAAADVVAAGSSARRGAQSRRMSSALRVVG